MLIECKKRKSFLPSHLKNMVNIDAVERSMCFTMASFLRKDALVYTKEDLETETPRSARAAIERPTSRVSNAERNKDEGPAPAVLFRSIVSTATVFLLSALVCVFLLYSAMSYRWLVLEGLTDTVPPMVTWGLRFFCLGANCVERPFETASSCGRDESAVAMRFRGSLGLLCVGFVFFVIAGLIGSFLTKRFSYLRSVFKILRHNPEFFLRPAFRMHTEHPQLYRRILFQQEIADREAAQSHSRLNVFSSRKEKERAEADSAEMRSVTTSLRGAMADTSDLADLWESDTDDDAKRPGRSAPTHRPPQVQYRRSLKRKQDRLVRASQKIHELRRKSQTAIHCVLGQVCLTWFGWACIVAGTAIFHNTEGDWLHCGKSACDVMQDYSCAYGPGFATAITATLAASFCIVASVLVTAFGLADLYACLSATYELTRYHDAQITLVTVELSRGLNRSTQLTEHPGTDTENVRVLASETYTPRDRRRE